MSEAAGLDFLHTIDSAMEQGLENLSRYPDPDYYEDVEIEGPYNSSNHFEAVLEVLGHEEDVFEGLWRGYMDNDNLEKHFNSKDEFLGVLEELSTFVEYTLGYDEDQGLEDLESRDRYLSRAEDVRDTIGYFHMVI